MVTAWRRDAESSESCGLGWTGPAQGTCDRVHIIVGAPTRCRVSVPSLPPSHGRGVRAAPNVPLARMVVRRQPSCRLLLLASCSANILLLYYLLAARSLYTQPPQQATTAALSPPRGVADRALWLTVAIMTVPRNEDYLTATLESFAAVRPVDTSLSVEVLVLSSGAEHPAFERASQRYAGDALFRFATNEHRLLDRRPQLRDEGDRNRPGYRVRQQTRDFVSMLRLAAGRGAAHLLTMEDDFLACPLPMCSNDTRSGALRERYGAAQTLTLTPTVTPTPTLPLTPNLTLVLTPTPHPAPAPAPSPFYVAHFLNTVVARPFRRARPTT